MQLDVVTDTLKDVDWNFTASDSLEIVKGEDNGRIASVNRKTGNQVSNRGYVAVTSLEGKSQMILPLLPTILLFSAT